MKPNTKSLTEFVQDMRATIMENGGKPDVVAIKGTTYQELLKELSQPNPTIFGMELIIKPDDYFRDGTVLIVADNMSVYPPIKPIAKQREILRKEQTNATE